jgi:hypothetical protein
LRAVAEAVARGLTKVRIEIEGSVANFGTGCMGVLGGDLEEAGDEAAGLRAARRHI